MTYTVSYTPEVRRALDEGEPVVALESTILTHGMPPPQNGEIALEVEDLVRKEGAVPATIAIIKGRVRVGLHEEELRRLASLADSPQKFSTRDLPYALAKELTGGTTVAATMVLAHLAGISVFVTGGIGGVHRDVASTWDISADLHELSRTPVLVVCAGAKSILDLGKTLEVLETYSVPVVGYGTWEFPAFFSQESGYTLDQRVDSPEEAALVFRDKEALGIPGGMVLANPIPQQEALPRATVEPILLTALAKAQREGVKGKALTPFLLRELTIATQGTTLVANRALIRHNARVGAKIAQVLAS